MHLSALYLDLLSLDGILSNPLWPCTAVRPLARCFIGALDVSSEYLVESVSDIEGHELFIFGPLTTKAKERAAIETNKLNFMSFMVFVLLNEVNNDFRSIR